MTDTHSKTSSSEFQDTRSSKVRKILLEILGIVVAQFLLITVVAFYFTRDLAKSADEFFRAVDQNNLEKAYGYLSEDLQTSISPPELKRYLHQVSITNIEKTSWKNRVKRNGQGYIEGGLTTDSGDVVPIRVNFVKEKQGWGIDSIEQFAEVISNEH
ncbi:MAG: hypothetical protein F6K11_30515 [Leptolyngbya sp. SIO3F4]|nr:hypothetical protein [Leptolyngbya sp. SIO3F4]